MGKALFINFMEMRLEFKTGARLERWSVVNAVKRKRFVENYIGS